MRKEHTSKHSIVKPPLLDINKLVTANIGVYAYVNEMHGEMLNLSIVTEELLAYDKKMLTKENYTHYKPYFCEFFCDALQNKGAKYLANKYTGKWVKVKFKNCADVSGYFDIKGFLLISMSPFKKVNMKIEYNYEELDADRIKTINDTYKIDHDSILLKNETDENYIKLRDELNLHSLGINYKIRIYNVGQGNCIYLRSSKKGEQTRRILFDIGMTIRKDIDLDEIQARIKSLSRIKPDIMILSHWDVDHLLGVYLVDEKSYAEVWLAPDYQERRMNQSISRLAKYLCLYKKLYLIGDYFKGKLVYNSEYMQIYKGKIKGKGYNKPNQIANNHGLILLLENNHGVDILPGDCEYDMWPDIIWEQINGRINMVVPHHCANMVTKAMSDICQRVQPNNAIISVGDNTYGHPNEQHRCDLYNMGYSVSETRNTKWIDISNSCMETFYE